MSKVEELEKAIASLPAGDFAALAAWIDERRRLLSPPRAGAAPAVRDHSAFLNSYTPEDDGLYDNGQTG